jgi:PAS domain S-box-containing protein
MTTVVNDPPSALGLGASEARYRRLFETAQDAILILDGDSGKIIDANPFVIDLLGYSLDQLMGKELWEIGLFRDIAESKAAFERLKRDGYIRYEDLPLETRDGKRAEVEFVSNVYDVDGCTVIQCNIRDITDRKYAERAAKEGTERFRFLAESMPQMVFTAKPNGDVDYFNQQWSAFTGFSFEEIKDWRWTRFIHPDDLAETVKLWSHSLRTGEPFEFQHRFRRADGIHRWHLSRACPMRDAAGTITMWISSNTDIDDQKRTEGDLSRLYRQAESLNRAKDDFLATVSHELRTPMTSILGWTALLTMGILDESTRREGIATIHRSAQVQAALIDDVLDVSRMITGKLHLTIEPIDMENVLRAALAAVVPAAKAKNIQVGMNVQPGLTRLGGDAVRLQQVFWNLLSNALKFTPADGRIDIRLFSRNSTIVVEVRDTGVGINPGFLPHAFDRFAQQDSSTKRSHGGMGIGLSIVKQLVELHGGTVSATSEGEGHGSTFTVSLPVQATMPEPPVPNTKQDRRANLVPVAIPSIAGLRLLVVDDEPDSRRTIAAILEQYGAIVTPASSAAEGLALAAGASFDVLLCDIAMPEQDGYFLIRNIRSPGDEKSRIPAVAVTAYGRPTEREIALAEGFDEYLKKPLEPAELISLVASMMQANA